jgi:transcriptional regulator with XRE-family HTH domain
MSGPELRRIRKGLGLTQTQFARLLGYTHYSRISQMETGKENVPKVTERLARMYCIYGIPSDSSGCLVQPVISPIDDAWTMLEIMSEIDEIAKKGILPDGDGVNGPTKTWAKDAARRFKEKYKTVKIFKRG